MIGFSSVWSNVRGDLMCTQRLLVVWLTLLITLQPVARAFAWWDTGTRRLRWISLPDTEFSVGPGVAARTGTGLALPWLTNEQRLLLLGGLVLLCAALWLVWRLLPKLPLARWRRQLENAWHFLQALRRPALPASLNPGSNAEE